MTSAWVTMTFVGPLRAAYARSMCTSQSGFEETRRIIGPPLLLGNTTRSDFDIKSVFDNWILLYIYIYIYIINNQAIRE